MTVSIWTVKFLMELYVYTDISLSKGCQLSCVWGVRPLPLVLSSESIPLSNEGYILLKHPVI